MSVAAGGSQYHRCSIVRAVCSATDPQVSQVWRAECSSVIVTSVSWLSCGDCKKHGPITSYSLRGPAPVHHAILRGDEHIGITLQSLDEKAFDHGTVLAQTPPPGLPIPPGSSLPELTQFLAEEGAKLLVQGLRDRVHEPPLQDVGQAARQLAAAGEPAYAPKVTKADSQIDWHTWTADDFARRLRVFGAVWTQATPDKGEPKRVILLDAEPAAAGGEGRSGRLSLVRDARDVQVDERTGSCAVRIRDGLWVSVRRVKVDGKPEQAAAVGLRPFITVKPAL